MLLCPKCKNEELSGALFCGQCGYQLFDADDETNTLGTGDIKTPPVISLEPPPFPTPPEEYQNCKVVIYLIDTEEEIFVEGDSDITIGRFTEGQMIIPSLDLSAYNAYEKGVSRLHAKISFTDNQVISKDLGSANGTRLNGKKLTAHAEHSLKHGDILTLAKLKIQILIRE